jgi:Tol biopolymer transport system component
MKWVLLCVGLLAAGAWGYTELAVVGGRSPAAQPAAGGAADSVTARRIWVASAAQYPFKPPSLDGGVLPVTDWDDPGEFLGLDLRSGQLRRLASVAGDTTGFEHFSIASHDGRRIAYTWQLTGDVGHELRLIDIPTGVVRVLVGADQFVYTEPADWSPDGRYVAASATRSDGATQILLVDIDDGSYRVLKSLPPSSYPGMSFSPDGRYLAYDAPADSEGRFDVYIISVDATREQRITTDPADDRLLGWSPDGSTLLYTNKGGTSPAVWAVRVNEGRRSGEPVLIRDGFWNAHKLGFTRDGTYYYVVIASQFDVFTVDIDPVTYQPVAPPVRVSNGFEVGGAPVARTVAWSRDGRFLALNGRRYTNPKIRIRNMVTGEVREIAPDVDPVDRIRWSADGGALYATSRGAWRRGIHRIDWQTGKSAFLVDDESVGAHELSLDDSVVYYDLRNVIVAHHLGSGRIDTLYRGDAAAAHARPQAMSPDGRTLAVRYWPSNSVAVLPVTGGTPRELVRAGEGEMLADAGFSHDGAWVIYTHHRAGGRTELWRAPVAGGSPERIALEHEHLVGASVHPSGTRLVFTAGQERYEVWALENIPDIAGGNR